MQRHLSQIARVAGLVIVMVIAGASPGWAASGDGAPGGAGASCAAGDASCSVWVGLPGGGGGGAPTHGSVTCEYTPGPPWVLTGSPGAVIAVGDQDIPAPPGGMQWVLSRCVNHATGEERSGIVLVRIGAGTDPAGLAQQAAGQLVMPAPVPATSPPLGRDVAVGVPVWLWLEPAPGEVSATASVPGLSATVTATLAEVVWEMGDGTRVVCDGPGVAWAPGMPEDASNCRHTYRFTALGLPGEVFRGSVTTRWRTRWSASDGSAGELAGVSRSTPFTMRVVEVQAVNTR